MATPNRPKSDWIALLEKANASHCDTIPAGFKSLQEWLDEFEISEATWQRKVPLLEREGILQRGYFRVIIADGRTLKKPFWKKK